MDNGIDILLALAGVIVGLEVVLQVFRGTLLRSHQTQRLQRQAQEAQEELRQVQERSKLRQAELSAARTQAETALATLRKASRELADSQRPGEVLIHRLGEVGVGTLFRAPINKELPPTPEENQTLLWSYRNFVDVWATDATRAHEGAARNFADKAGYVLGPFAPVAPAEPAAPAAAPARQAAAASAAAE